MNKVLEEFSKIGIIPVIALDHVEDAAPLAKALCDGGLPCAEVTLPLLLRSPSASCPSSSRRC